MGKLKKEIFQVIDFFVAENKNIDTKQFIGNLQKLINQLTLFINKNYDINITEDTVVINTDGSSRGNPGEAKIGIVIKNSSGNVLLKEQKEIGVYTNNQSEYHAAIESLRISLVKKFKKVVLFSDSEVMIKQINNEYKVNNPQLKKLYNEIKTLEKQFEFIKFIHIKREKNKEADRLSR